MPFVLPATSTLHLTSYLAPQTYEYLDQDYHHTHPNGPRFAYPASQQHSSSQTSTEELGEHEYQRALAVISNYNRHRAEKEANIRRQQQAEVARQRHLASVSTQLEEQRQQAELLASHRAEVIRTQQARARLAAAERQLAVKEFLCRSKDARPVCRVCTSFRN